MYYLIKYEDNWQNEMNVEAHIVLGEKNYTQFQHALNGLQHLSLDITPQQTISYKNGAELDACLTIHPLSQEMYELFESCEMTETELGSQLVRTVVKTAMKTGGYLEDEQKLNLYSIKEDLRADGYRLEDMRRLQLWVYWNEEEGFVDSLEDAVMKDGNVVELVETMYNQFPDHVFQELSSITNHTLRNCLDKNLLQHLNDYPYVTLWFCGKRVPLDVLLSEQEVQLPCAPPPRT